MMIVERSEKEGLGKKLLDWLRQPLSKAIVIVCLVVAGAILLEATLGGSWAERPAKPRPVADKKVSRAR